MSLKRLFVLLFLFNTTSVLADELTAIEVQSSVLSNTVSESQYPIAIIGRSDISSSQSIGSNVGSNINSIPGVSNSDYGTAVGQPVIRGLSGSRVRILSNSNIVNDLSYFSADHANMVNLSNASHIELIKGPSSIFNFGGTSGGVVNIISGSITDKLYTTEKLSIGRSYDTVSEGYTNNFLLKKNMNSLSLFLSYDKRDHFNYDLSSGSLYEDGAEKHNLANSDFSDKNTTVGLSMIKDWGYLGFSFENIKGTYGIPYHAEEEEEEEEEEGEHRIFSTHKTDTFSLKGRMDGIGFANSLDFSFSNSNSSLKEHEEDGSFKTLNNNSSALNLKFNLDTNEIERRMLISYIHQKSPMSSNAYVPSSESYEKSLAYFTNINLIGNDMDVVARYDNNERLTSTKKYEDSAISISANSKFHITNNLNANIGYSHVSRSPNMAELFADGKHGATNRYEKGSDSLTREVARNIDLGLNYQLSNSTITFDVFRNNINDFIYLRDLGTTNYDGEHQDADWSQKNAIIQGYEVSFVRPIVLGGTDMIITLSRDDLSGIFDDDTYIPRMPSARNMIDLTILGDKNERYKLSLIHSETQSDFSSIETETNSYIDMTLKYSNTININNTYDLNMDIFASNLLDKTRRNHASFVKANVPLPGASYGVNLSVDYKF